MPEVRAPNHVGHLTVKFWLFRNSRALLSETDVDFREIVPSLGTRLNNTTMRVKDIEGSDWKMKTIPLVTSFLWKNQFAKSSQKLLWLSWKLKCLTSLWSVKLLEYLENFLTYFQREKSEMLATFLTAVVIDSKSKEFNFNSPGKLQSLNFKLWRVDRTR